MQKNTKKSKFKLFDTQREGRGVEKGDVYTKTDLKGFFIRYKTYFTRLISVNLLMVLGNFPLLFALLAMSTLTKVVYMMPASAAFPLLHGLFIGQAEIPVSTLVSIGIEGMFAEGAAMTWGTYLLFGLSLLVMFTFGIVNVGTTYVLRNMAKGDPVFIWSDFLYAIRRNWKQALPFGILDAILLALIPYDILYLSSAEGGVTPFLLGAIIVIALLYFWMRFYIYLQMVTFDLSIKKILKNSLIFSLIGFKRNFMATLGILLLLLINVFLGFGFYGIFSATAILFPFLLLFSNGAFMSTYAAYYKMKAVMIDPYSDNTAENESKEPDGDSTDEPLADADPAL